MSERDPERLKRAIARRSVRVKTLSFPENSDGRFPETQWSLVLQAGGPSAPAARQAMETLCEAYWYPIYAFIRRKGKGPHEAHDLTQDYFCRFLKKGALAAADRERGRFRTFLLTDCKHFLVDAERYRKAGIRHPRTRVLSIDERTAEGRYLNEPAHGQTPERIFERNWALSLLECAFSRIRAEYTRAGKSLRYEQLKLILTGPSRSIPYAEVAGRLGTSEEAIATAVHRLRKRFKTVLREEVAATLADPADIDDEIRAMFDALKS